MLVRVLAPTLQGIDARPVEVETDIARGLPSYTVVGLAAGPVRESGDRIRAAVRNSGYEFPGRKITVNLAPADLRKDGALLDLPIALSILCAEGLLPAEGLHRHIVSGELSLDGSVKPVRGVLSQGLLAREMGMDGVMVPAANAAEAALIPGLSVIPASTLRDAVRSLSGELPAGAPPASCDSPTRAPAPAEGPAADLRDVSGQAAARRVLEIAAAGEHALLLVGNPGCGKTMLAERLPGILPGFRDGEAIETARVYSAAGESPWPRILWRRPFRTPHHSVTMAGLVGGGSPPRPGEISFAHGGVLFLDEFSEFRRDAREALRQPMEAGEVRLARAAAFYRFPSRFLLVAATNPCPCGNHGHPRRICRCSPLLMARFAQKFSGPLLDRIDLSVVVPPLSGDEWCAGGAGEESASVRRRVEECRAIQAARYSGAPFRTNGAVRIPLREMLGSLTPEARGILGREADRNALSGRAIGKICRVSRTIADMAGEARVGRPHVAEALRCRLPPFAATRGPAPR